MPDWASSGGKELTLSCSNPFAVVSDLGGSLLAHQAPTPGLAALPPWSLGLLWERVLFRGRNGGFPAPFLFQGLFFGLLPSDRQQGRDSSVQADTYLLSVVLEPGGSFFSVSGTAPDSPLIFTTSVFSYSGCGLWSSTFFPSGYPT